MTNSFGEYFRITTFGESHGEGVGVVIDGAPPEIEFSEEEIFQSLKKRRPASSCFVSPRKEPDIPKILSGVYLGKTTGAPLCIWIANKDARPEDYAQINHLIRPSHAGFTYAKKYTHFDPRGGGRASARETAARAAAAVLAEKICAKQGIRLCSHLKQVGSIAIPQVNEEFEELVKRVESSSIFCSDRNSEKKITALLSELKEQGDSIGGIVESVATGLPVGLGDPQYMKIEAQLAQAMLSIPATKGFEIGSGFQSACLKGSEHNDKITSIDPYITVDNFAGGVLGGITTGEDIVFRVAFKPTSSIKKRQQTFDFHGNKSSIRVAQRGRHDLCLAIRGVQVVKSMALLTLADRILASQSFSRSNFI